MAELSPPAKRRHLNRVIAACDLCKSRKTKCDGTMPCAYCAKRSHACTYSSLRTAVPSQLQRPSDLEPTVVDAETSSSRRDITSPSIVTPSNRRDSGDDDNADTAVPLEAQLLQAAQGTAVFIGDCAPLSFLQTIRHLVTSEADSTGLSEQMSGAFIMESAPEREPVHDGNHSFTVQPSQVKDLVLRYFLATSGLIDLFDKEQLEARITAWAAGKSAHTDAATSASYFLVLAIGAQEIDGQRAERWSKHARDDLTTNMCRSMNVATVQGFVLFTVYLLRACQANGAYNYCALASRAAYAIGLHRTEVNASFGPAAHLERDRIWKTVRVVDMATSGLLGRPTSSSDSDCTVKYHGQEGSVGDGEGIGMSMIDATAQIFMVHERIVEQVYSRKRISLHIANHVSRHLRDWASRWLEKLSADLPDPVDKSKAIGACQIICQYYNTIMLLTRPFLIYDIYAHLGAPLRASGTHADELAKKEYADAAIDAAISLVDTMRDVIESGGMPLKMPLLVSWLFVAALVLAIGIMGRSGLPLETHCRASLQCLSHFAKADPHARQYTQTVRSLLSICVKHARDRELRRHDDRRRASTRLFGLHPAKHDSPVAARATGTSNNSERPTALRAESSDYNNSNEATAAGWMMYDTNFIPLQGIDDNDLALQDFLQPGRQTTEGSLADVPLFPMYDQLGSMAHRNGF